MELNWRKTLYFLVLSFLLSWGLFFGYLTLGGKWESSWTTVMMVGYMIMPALAAILVQRAIFHEPLRPLGLFFHWDRWYWIGWVLPVVIALLTFAVGLLLPGVDHAPDMGGIFERFRGQMTEQQFREMKEMLAGSPVSPLFLMIGQALLAGITVNALFAFGEELGWRGMLHRQLIRYGFWVTAFLTGLVWGVWHIPAILMGHNYPDHPVKGVLLMILFCLLWSPLFTFIRLRTGSVFPVAILHGTINASTGLAIAYLQGGSDLTVGVTGLAGLVVLGMVNLGLLMYDKRFPIREHWT